MGRCCAAVPRMVTFAMFAGALSCGCAREAHRDGVQVDADSRAQPSERAAAGAPDAAPESRHQDAVRGGEADREIIAYYFHRTIRCPTCLSIESQARDAIRAGFPQEIAAGRLKWLAVDVEEPGNEHFEKDFALEASSLVIVEQREGKNIRWKNLERVWELYEDSDAFRDYVQKEVAAYLRP